MPPVASWSRRVITAVNVGRLAFFYLAFGVLKHVIPLGVLARVSWRAPTRQSDGGDEQRAVARVTKLRKVLRVPDRDCLQQSLVLYRELSRVGLDPVLVVGFRTEASHLVGHAWIEAGGRVIADTGAGTAPFVPVCSFGRHGRVLSGTFGPQTT